jgi:hypothetical protein
MSNPRDQRQGGGEPGNRFSPPKAGQSPASGDHSHEQHRQGEHGPTRGQGQKPGHGHHEPGQGSKNGRSYEHP